MDFEEINGYICLLYDFNVKIMETRISPEIAKIHKIKPQRYFIIEGTDKVLPDDIGLGKENSEEYYIRHSGQLASAQLGKRIEVTLVKRIKKTDVRSILKKQEKYDIRKLTFKPGELEEILEEAKKEFLSKLDKAGIKGDKSKIYFELYG